MHKVTVIRLCTERQHYDLPSFNIQNRPTSISGSPGINVLILDALS